MKIFLDTAIIDEIREANSWGILDGITTNPSLIAKSNMPFRDVVNEIVAIVNGPISVEVLSEKAVDMVKEAIPLAEINKNIVIKIPMCKEGLKAVSELKRRSIKTNMTLIFSLPQALMAVKAGASYVSPFVGRLDDIGSDGMSLIKDIVGSLKLYGFTSEVIAASIRHPMHIVESIKAGAHIATVPFGVLKQSITHPLTDIGIERFLSDWKRVKA